MIPRASAPSLKRVASVFADAQNRSSKNDKGALAEFDETTLEEYAAIDSPKVRVCR